ncbi:Alpha/Beta hydrolase protein [Dactylonectria estremocensis]|uniref:Carboxylic ester hydrolase n=1 Tax=Dactylonectria estremocensis TaxID=1079267 RepID=A0A9P9IW97_9HYPO|nr:Alpha/Beta hydrolase protein [Dactylonectria estremocensis]
MVQTVSIAVQLDACTIVGISKPASETQPRPLDVFYGIPFARAQRFERPMPATLPSRLDATKPGDACPGLASFSENEDCLRLNITRPARTAADVAGWPVLVFIHGGAFNFGSALERNMESTVSWSEQPIVAVSVTYRLGVLGFPAAPGEEGRKAYNLGLRDQAAALQWVVERIGAFGGDGASITVVGASAGGHSAGHLLLSPSPPPFHKAILESGSPTARLVLSPTHPQTAAQFAFLLQDTRCSSLADLKVLPLRTLLDGATQVWSRGDRAVQWPFQPVVDGDGDGGVIPDLPVRLWEQRVADGRAGNMCVMTGFCSHEGISFVPISANTNADFRKFFTTLIPSLSAADLTAMETLYPDPVTDPSSPYVHGSRKQGRQFRRLAAAYGEFAYIAPVLHTAHVLSAAGARVYVYEYAEPSGPHRTAEHGAQSLAMERHASSSNACPGLAETVATLHGFVTAFVSSPEGDLGDSWPAFVGSGSPGAVGEGNILVFGAPDRSGSRLVPVQPRVLEAAEMERMRFWWERMELAQGMGQMATRQTT